MSFYGIYTPLGWVSGVDSDGAFEFTRDPDWAELFDTPADARRWATAHPRAFGNLTLVQQHHQTSPLETRGLTARLR